MTEIRDEKIVGLELRHNAEEDTLGVRLVVAVNVTVEPLAPAAHVLTVVAQRVDHLFLGDEPGEAHIGQRGFAAVTVCDPGGLLDETGSEVLRDFIQLFMEWRWPELEELCERELGEEEE